jgi:hypothetical protein
MKTGFISRIPHLVIRPKERMNAFKKTTSECFHDLLSPDLNPIEHMWYLMDRELIKIDVCSLADLEVALYEV